MSDRIRCRTMAHTAPSMTSLPSGYRAVVVGASGGLGRAFVELLEADAHCGGVTGLGRNSVPSLDVTDEPSIAAAAAVLKASGPVDLLVDATGVLHDNSMLPEKTLDSVRPTALVWSFANNAIGPLLLAKHFHSALPRRGKSVFATLSARVGSIADNRLGGWYAYRMSKAALNMALRTAAVEIARKRPDAVCLALHPGTVATPLSAPFGDDGAKTRPEEAARRLLAVIDGCDASRTGSFLAYDGTEIPW
ncbi:MAG: SDR family NAD(P)-dependent oxidoreductase [Hyphomicrobiales bacterium]|nr:SDR family NAD(P)-dependent oxidoreductase [Hyphomicrobiales bacterium]